MGPRAPVILAGAGLCACAVSDGGFSRRSADEYVALSGAMRYHLPDLPAWARASPSAGCAREAPVRFLDFGRLGRSFGYDHGRSASLQQLFNVARARRLEGRPGAGSLGLREEEDLFNGALGDVDAGRRVFRRPAFKRVHLVWIDPFVTGARDAAALKGLFGDGGFAEGHPVLVTLCLDHAGAERFAGGLGLPGSVRTLSSELMTPFGPDLALSHRTALYVDPLFGRDQELVLYAPAPVPAGLVGTFLEVRRFPLRRGGARARPAPR